MPKLYKSKKNTSMRSKKTKTHARNKLNKCRKNKTLMGGAHSHRHNPSKPEEMIEMKILPIIHFNEDYKKLTELLEKQTDQIKEIEEYNRMRPKNISNEMDFDRAILFQDLKFSQLLKERYSTLRKLRDIQSESVKNINRMLSE